MKKAHCRGLRGFSFELEGRLLLASGLAAVPAGGSVQFSGFTSPGSASLMEVVGQQDGPATVMLTRSNGTGKVQVQVTTDPSSPAVGVNVGAVNQTVTFPKNQKIATFTVPILAGAPNPGEVDVNLDVTPITPGVTTTGPLELRILANGTITPQIISVTGKPHGIVLTFNKAMNPAGASNANNYAVNWEATHSSYNDLGPFSLLIPGPWPPGLSISSGSVRLKSAEYDAATNSVTLIPRRGFNYSAGNITVSNGQSGTQPDGSNRGPGLTDLEGNPILDHPGDPNPGFFLYSVSPGSQLPEYHVSF